MVEQSFLFHGDQEGERSGEEKGKRNGMGHGVPIALSWAQSQ